MNILNNEALKLIIGGNGSLNNGNGNNLDGVDSSNPGKGVGGPNGAVDPSGGFDDEIGFL